MLNSRNNMANHKVRNIYFKPAVDLILKKYAAKMSLSYSDLITKSLLNYIQTADAGKISVSAKKLKILDDLCILEEELKLDLKQAFFDSNIKKLMLKVIAKATSKEEILEVLETFNKMASAMEHKHAQFSVEGLIKEIKHTKRFEAVQNMAREYVGLYVEIKESEHNKERSRHNAYQHF